MHYLNETLLQTIARVLFLHEELMKLPSFPRKALESDLSLNSNGSLEPLFFFFLFSTVGIGGFRLYSQAQLGEIGASHVRGHGG